MYYGDSKKQSRSYCRERTSPLPPFKRGNTRSPAIPPLKGVPTGRGMFYAKDNKQIKK